MSINEGYTLRNRPEITLTREEIWEVSHYCDALQGLDSIAYWLDNEAPYEDPNDEDVQALIKYADAHREDLDLGAEVWENYMETCTYDMGYEEMSSVVRCLRERVDYDS